MPNRRNFFKTVASATAGMLAMWPRVVDVGVLVLQGTPPKRREVLIGKRRIKVIDVHGHFIAPEELDVIKDT
ncbi:MAG: hypothetical protein DMG12_24240, partial [Acidobacteria bacterium]